MKRHKDMQISIHHIPDDTMQQYQLNSLIINNFVMVKFWKEMYGLPQAGIISHNQLQTYLTNKITLMSNCWVFTSLFDSTSYFYF